MADQTQTAALEAQHLTLSWDGEHIVVRDITLHVAPGEVVCMVGRSGCGKTTILHALSGLTQPMEGQVLLHGKPITGQPGHVSYMLQKDLLLPSKRIIDNVSLPLVIGGMDKAAARQKAAPLFERFGLAGTEQSWPSQLSGGMRQRAAFLRTYLMGNDVTLLDEPFSALDALTRVDMRSWYCDMAHDLGIARGREHGQPHLRAGRHPQRGRAQPHRGGGAGAARGSGTDGGGVRAHAGVPAVQAPRVGAAGGVGRCQAYSLFFCSTQRSRSAQMASISSAISSGGWKPVCRR